MKTDKKMIDLSIRETKNIIEKELLELERDRKPLTSQDILFYFFDSTYRRNLKDERRKSVLEKIYKAPYVLCGIELDKEIVDILGYIYDESYKTACRHYNVLLSKRRITKDEYICARERLDYCYKEYLDSFETIYKNSNEFVKYSKTKSKKNLKLEEIDEIDLTIRIMRNSLEGKMLELEKLGTPITADEIVLYFYDRTYREKISTDARTSILESIYYDPYLLYGIKVDRQIDDLIFNMCDVSRREYMESYIGQLESSEITLQDFNYKAAILEYCYNGYLKKFKKNYESANKISKKLKKEDPVLKAMMKK